jgi:hypothetical protein
VRERPVEVHTDHLCVLAILARRLAESRDGDRAALAADAVDALLRAGQFDRCCVPRYLALAPERASSEIQIPIVREHDIATRVIVWPIGARDTAHEHAEGWAVFAPVRGSLESVASHDGSPERVQTLVPRRPRILRSGDEVEHRIRNVGAQVGLSVHVFGR